MDDPVTKQTHQETFYPQLASAQAQGFIKHPDSFKSPHVLYKRLPAGAPF
jgi:hypothetical protein